jgi:hypothetical protein
MNTAAPRIRRKMRRRSEMTKVDWHDNKMLSDIRDIAC